MDEPCIERRLVVSAVVALALALGAATLSLSPPISGRLHPAVVPAALAGLALVAALATMRPSPAPAPAVEAAAAGPILRPLLSLAVSVLVLAFGTRSIGVAATAFLCAATCSFGVRGVTLRQASLVALSLSVGLSLALAMLVRQPLPILPPVFLP